VKWDADVCGWMIWMNLSLIWGSLPEIKKLRQSLTQIKMEEHFVLQQSVILWLKYNRKKQVSGFVPALHK
jgi:hypothetical protein